MKVRIILSRKQHNRIFTKRKWKWNTKYIITDDKSKHCMEMCQHVRNHWKLLIWFCFPIVILLVGFPVYWNMVKEVFSGKSLVLTQSIESGFMSNCQVIIRWGR